jgi:hypothetical protein
MPEKETEEVREPDFVSTATFGPGFFLGQLRAFARESCPSSSEALPSVALHLATGEVLELCHVMGLAPAFVALAVFDDAKTGHGGARAMRTDLVPYSLITRVTIRPRHESGAHVGFDAGHAPQVIVRTSSPEETLKALSTAPQASGNAERTATDPERS